MNKLSLATVSGVVFAVLFVLGLFLPNVPVGGEARTDEKIRAFYADSGDRTQVVVAVYVLAAAGIAFALFLAGLYDRLRETRRPNSTLPMASLILGVTFLAMLFASGAALGAIAGGIQLGGEPEVLGDTGVARFLAHTGYALIAIYGALAAAAMITCVSALALKDPGLLPKWLVWAGFVMAALLLFGVIFLPLVALPLWVLGASFALSRQRTA